MLVARSQVVHFIMILWLFSKLFHVLIDTTIVLHLFLIGVTMTLFGIGMFGVAGGLYNAARVSFDESEAKKRLNRFLTGKKGGRCFVVH